MTEKVYEYKDDHNWFIGKWGGYGGIAELGQTVSYGIDYFKLARLIDQAYGISQDAETSYDIVVVKISEEKELVRFVLDMLDDKFSRRMTVVDCSGVLVLVEDGLLKATLVPESGVAMETFLEEMTLRDWLSENSDVEHVEL